MRLGSIVSRDDEVEGDWELYAEGEGAEAGEKIEFLIAPIPADEELRIEKKYLGRERKFVLTEAGRQLTNDIEKTAAFHQERALHALRNCRTNVWVTVAGEASAQKLSELLGQKVEPGKLVLDGKLNGIDGGARALKEILFKHLPAVAIWISGKADQKKVTAARNEEGKENS